MSIGGNYEGTVEEIGLFLTSIKQANGILLTIPNSTVWNSTIINFSRNANRLIDLPVALHYGEDTEEAIALLKRLLERNEQVIKDLPYSVYVNEYRENSLVLNLRAWVPAAVYFDELPKIMLGVRKTLEAAGFDLPFTRVEHISAAHAKDVYKRQLLVLPLCLIDYSRVVT